MSQVNCGHAIELIKYYFLDLSFAVSQVNRFYDAFMNTHVTVIKNFISCLVLSSKKGTIYIKESKDLNPKCHVNADFCEYSVIKNWTYYTMSQFSDDPHCTKYNESEYYAPGQAKRGFLPV